MYPQTLDSSILEYRPESDMSEEVICPYCGSAPWSGVSPQGDATRKVRCDRCGGIFEYIPGFGAFSLPEMGRGDRTGDYPRDRFVARPGPSFDQDRYDFPKPEEEQPGCGDCCGTCCCICLLFVALPYFFFF